MVVPIILLVFSDLPFLSCYTWINDNRDYYVGFFLFLCFIATYFIKLKIDEQLRISNTFREEYDVQVFGMSKNNYFYDEQCIKRFLEISNNTINDSKKYIFFKEICSTTEFVL